MIDPVITLQIGAAAVALVGLSAYAYAMKHSGRDRPRNEAAVRVLLNTAPYDRLDRVTARPDAPR